MSHCSGTIKPGKSCCDMVHPCSPGPGGEPYICGFGGTTTCTPLTELDKYNGGSCKGEGLCMWYRAHEHGGAFGAGQHTVFETKANCAPPISPNPCQYVKPGGQWCPWGRITEQNGQQFANTDNFYTWDDIWHAGEPKPLQNSPYNYGWPVRCDQCAANTPSYCSSLDACGFDGKSDCKNRVQIADKCGQLGSGICAWYRRGIQGDFDIHGNPLKDEMQLECAKSGMLYSTAYCNANPSICCPNKKGWCRFGRHNNQTNNFYDWENNFWDGKPETNPWPGYYNWPSQGCTYAPGITT